MKRTVSMFRQDSAFVMDALLLPSCALCGEPASPASRLCSSCQDAIPRQVWAVDNAPANIRSSWFLLPYKGMGGQLVRCAKYGAQPLLIREMSRILARAAASSLGFVDALVPVPSTYMRNLRRGFSLPWAFSRTLARAMGLPCRRYLAHAHSLPQAGLARKERILNIAGAIKRRGSVESGSVLLLVDDVATTGATASTCASVLLDSGAAAVHLLTFASALS